MIEIDIPGLAKYQLSHLVLDVNGTLATDGELLDGVKERLDLLRDKLTIHLLTADTHGKQDAIDQVLRMKAIRIGQGNEAENKFQLIDKIGADKIVAIGNGANDKLMLAHAALAIAVIGAEGAFTGTLMQADIVCRSIHEALDLLLYPKRIVATLRS